MLGLLLVAAVLVSLMGAFGPARTLDKLPWYTAPQGLKLLADLGPEGRRSYLRNECLDLAFLLVYSVFAFIATGWIWEARLSAPAVRRGQYLSLLLGVIDLAETSLVISTLAGYPEGLAAKISWLCLATPAKWFAASVLILSALGGAAFNFRKPRPEAD